FSSVKIDAPYCSQILIVLYKPFLTELIMTRVKVHSNFGSEVTLKTNINLQKINLLKSNVIKIYVDSDSIIFSYVFVFPLAVSLYYSSYMAGFFFLNIYKT